MVKTFFFQTPVYTSSKALLLATNFLPANMFFKHLKFFIVAVNMFYISKSFSATFSQKNK